MQLKLCTKCNTPKDTAEFSKRARSKDGLAAWCKACVSEYRKSYHLRNLGEQRKQLRHYMRAVKDEVIAGYGGKCACCGESTRQFLTLDHVDGRKGQTRWQLRNGWHYRDAKKRNFPPDYQVLCFNCNCAKGHFGICPHKLENPNSNDKEK